MYYEIGIGQEPPQEENVPEEREDEQYEDMQVTLSMLNFTPFCVR